MRGFGLDKYEWKKLLSMGVLRANKCCEGIICVTNGSKWGAMTFENVPIIPILYDFIDIDEYEYGAMWIVCGRDGYHYMNEGDDEIYYSGKYDIYNFSGEVIVEGVDHYDNGNHPIRVIMFHEF